MDMKVEHRGQQDAEVLVDRINDEIGKLSVDIADVVGDVQQVSALIDSQTEQFHSITQATREIADQRFANRRHVAMTLGHAAEAERGDLGTVVGKQDGAGIRLADFRDGG